MTEFDILFNELFSEKEFTYKHDVWDIYCHHKFNGIKICIEVDETASTQSTNLQNVKKCYELYNDLVSFMEITNKYCDIPQIYIKHVFDYNSIKLLYIYNNILYENNIHVTNSFEFRIDCCEDYKNRQIFCDLKKFETYFESIFQHKYKFIE